MLSLLYWPTKKEYLSTLTGELYTDDYLDMCLTLQKEHKRENKTPSFTQLVKDYPEAVPAIKRNLKARQKDLKIDIQICEVDEDIFNHVGEYESELKRIAFQLSYLQELITPSESKQFGISTMDIEMAKQIPICTFIKVNHAKKALCLFHNDKHESMHIYDTNRYWCFSCGASGSVVDIIMQMYNCTFLEAVKKLLNK